MASVASFRKHPIHPMLIPFPIALWIFSLACDVIYAFEWGGQVWNDMAFYSMAAGLLGAAVAAIPGYIDFRSLSDTAVRKIGRRHMLINLTIVALFSVNLWLRMQPDPAQTFPIILSIVAVALLGLSGWLGGELVYVHGVAVERQSKGSPEAKERMGRLKRSSERLASVVGIMPLPIFNANVTVSDYALIGDCRSAALVSNHGSIDWLCLPNFDSSSIFNRLLDQWHGGHFTIMPAAPFSVRRWYHNSTAALATEYETEDGTVRLTDLMPVLARPDTRLFPPFRSLLRVAEGVAGTVALQILFKPRPDHGRVVPTFRARGSARYVVDLGRCLLHLSTDVPLEMKHGVLEGQATVKTRERYVFWLGYSEDAPAVYPVLSQTELAIEETTRFWRGWTEACTYQGPYRDEVLRSAVTLKLLSFAPSGAIVGAPTTSLPEVIGGGRNWDYRYCWLRDASYTASLFFRIGYRTEATAFLRWLMHATALTYPALQVLYDVYGEARLPEEHLDFLEGYRGSQPVRTGNQAYAQFQHDIYGQLLDSLLSYVEAGNNLDREMRRRLVQMADLVCSQWTFPDHGIWEIPHGRRHYVHSKVMCWVALDRAERIVRTLGLRAEVQRWQHVRESIRRTVLEAAYSTALQSFVQTLGGTDVDATALTFMQTGFIEPDDDRVGSTIKTVRARLGRGDLVYRYRRNDGLAGEEGAFLPCSFWLVEALAMTGEQEEARQLFERLQKLANDVGLYSEEMDPATGMMLGNFPQALTHLAHIGAALRLDHGR